MSSMIAGAIGVSAAIGVGASVVSAGVGMYGASKSADAAEDASKRNNALASSQYQQTREDQEPWRLAGMRALDRIEEQPDFNFTGEEFDFMADPSYEWRKQEGINALDRSAASRGRTLSGGQDRAVTRYGSDLASTEYQNAFNRHQTGEVNRFNMEQGEYNTNMNTNKSLANVGQQATANIQNAGQNMVSTSTTSNNALAKAQGSAYGSMADSVGTGFENALIAYNKPVKG